MPLLKVLASVIKLANLRNISRQPCADMSIWPRGARIKETTTSKVSIYSTFITYTSLICLPCRNEIVKSLLIVHCETKQHDYSCDMSLQLDKSAHTKHVRDLFLFNILVP